MTRHKFKLGQSVDLALARPGMPTTGRQYEFVRLLPLENGELLYRVKSTGDTFERMVRESELSGRSPI